MRESWKECAREIGFNEDVTVGADTLHVQTEVSTRQGIEIKSTVLRRGNVLRVFTQPCPEGIELNGLRDIASEQHRRVLEEVARSE